MPARPLKVAVLAAGHGKRMRSDLPKVLHPLAGRPMVGYVVDTARALGPERIVVVVGHRAEAVRAYLGDQVTYAFQEQQLGTGHALLAAEEALGGEEADLVLLYGDTPLLSVETLRSLVSRHRAGEAAATVLTAVLDDPTGYGRIIRGAGGAVTRIVEEADATAEERQTKEVNTGVYCFRLPDVFPYLRRLTRDNRAGELYLVDVIALLLEDGRRVETVAAADPGEVEGVNTRAQLARAERLKRAAILEELMAGGVTVVDPASTFVDWGVEVGRDTVLEPGTHLRGATRVGSGCRIGPWAVLVDSTVADGCRVWVSVVEKSELRRGASVGPFSHLRPGSTIGEEARIGNFAEVKNSSVGARVKMQHHSYVGDADVGDGANIGAGAVVVNYDGLTKHRTVIGEGAFVGCNTNLVAPVVIGDGAYTAAGSTVTHDVPPGALGVARARQRNIEGWVERRRPGTVSSSAASRARGRSRESRAGGSDEAIPSAGQETGGDGNGTSGGEG